jgi:uroporphyrinogen-III synthase
VSGPLVVVTRAEAAGEGLRGALAQLGIDSRDFPTTRIEPALDPEPLARAVAGLDAFDWLAVTSVHAVDALGACPAWREAWRRGPRPRVAAVGVATAARLRDAGAPVDVVGDGPGGAALAHRLVTDFGEALRGARVLWPRSDRARPDLGDALEAAGAHLVAPVAYRTVTTAPGVSAWFVDGLARGEIAAVAFLSPSAVSGLAVALGAADLSLLGGRTRVASIGPTTSAALRALGAPPHVESPRPESHVFAEAMLACLGPRQGVLR